VGIKQILPDQELNLFVLKVSAKVFGHFYNEICLIWQSILIISQGFLTYLYVYLVDSIYCCIYLGCCKLLHQGSDVIPSHHIIWHLHELDLPALLPKEIRSRPQRGPM
jgi:hypothetical protein